MGMGRANPDTGFGSLLVLGFLNQIPGKDGVVRSVDGGANGLVGQGGIEPPYRGINRGNRMVPDSSSGAAHGAHPVR